MSSFGAATSLTSEGQEHTQAEIIKCSCFWKVQVVGGDCISWTWAERVLFRTFGFLPHWKRYPPMLPAVDLSLRQGLWAVLIYWGMAEEAEMEDLFSKTQPMWSIVATLIKATSHRKLRLPPYLKQHWESGPWADWETKLSQEHPADDC